MDFLFLLALLLLAVPIIAIVALVIAVGLRDQIRRMQSRLAAIEGRLAALPARPERDETAAQPVAPPPAVEAPPVIEPRPQPEDAAVPAAPPPDAVPSAASVPPVTARGVAAPARMSLEERMGTQWAVWIGGIALALGGIFLVRYSIEQGLLGPRERIALAGALAAALIATAEWLRRTERTTGMPGLPSANIPSILTAAGTIVAYGDIYAAYALYGFVGPAAAFILLGVVALATLAAALLHGPALAGLGLVGAYATPLLIATGRPNYWALYVYLAFVTASAFALARIRIWRWLAVTAIVLGVLWTLPGIGLASVEALAAHIFHVAIGFLLAAILIVAGFLFGPDAEPGRIDRVSSAALSAYLFALACLVIASRHDPLALAAFVVLVAATVAIAWRSEAAAAAVPVAALLVTAVMVRWALNLDLEHLVAPSGPVAGVVPEPERAEYGWHLTLAAAFALLFGLTGYFAQGRSSRPVVPLVWGAAAVFTPLAMLAALYYRIAELAQSFPFAAIALLLAALFATATEALSRRAPRPGIAAASAVFATGTLAALALALNMALEKGWLTIGLALLVPGIAWVSLRRPLPALRVLAAAVVALVVARIAWEPRIMGNDIGTTPIFNWLLYGYGIPAAAFWLGGALLRRRADDVPARMVDSGAILLTVLLAFLEIRHYVYAGDVYRHGTGLAELALQVCVGLALAIGLERLRQRTGNIVHNVAALLIAAFTLLGIVGLAVAENPVFTGEPVGGRFANLVLLGYGLPAILAGTLALISRGVRAPQYSAAAAVIAVALGLGYLSLEVRRLFRGEVLAPWSDVTDAEQYTYSVVWLAFGVLLLAAGVRLRSQAVRFASAAVVTLTVLKVFLIDMHGLTGIYQALSFMGLGVVLLGIGALYQRLLFPRGGRAAYSATS
jgi:uncharacterized membrane protein